MKDVIFIKKLPKIYQNTINKHINNNKKTYYIKNDSRQEQVINKVMDIKQIDMILDSIFNGFGHPFNIPVIIKTNTKTYETSLITRTNGYLLTLDNDKIKIQDIIYIQIKNP